MRKGKDENKHSNFFDRPLLSWVALICTVVGLLSFLRSDDDFVFFSTLILTILSLIVFIYFNKTRLAFSLKETLIFLSWKFFLGGLIGAILMFIFYPQINKMFYHKNHMSLVNLTHSEPQNNDTLKVNSQYIDIYFSQDIRPSDRNELKINILPNYPIEKTWIIPDGSYGPTPSNHLSIKPLKYYPNESAPRFAHNEKYTINIRGDVLQNEIEVSFVSP